MLFELSLAVASIALRIARSAFSHFVCSVLLGGAPQLENVASQSRLMVASHAGILHFHISNTFSTSSP
jgi:hypothetical protein